MDLDVIYGNFSRFAYLFQGQHAVVTSDFQGASGVAMFFKNEPFWRTLFLTGNPLYTLLLKNLTDYQLDEFSRKNLYVDTTIDRLIARAFVGRNRGENSNVGVHWKDKLWVEQDGSEAWAGPVLWLGGKLAIVRGSKGE